ncbi:MAG: alpha-L-rhamnosidase C-terminal domain-containing protein [Syntrophobacteraceae bacterium]
MSRDRAVRSSSRSERGPVPCRWRCEAPDAVQWQVRIPARSRPVGLPS